MSGTEVPMREAGGLSETNGTKNELPNGSNPLSATIDWASFKNIINGKLSSTTKTLRGTNPSTLDPLPEFPCSSQSDVDEAVKAARAAFPSWAATPVTKRAELVKAWADLAYKTHGPDLIAIIARETGKPPMLSGIEVGNAGRNLHYAASLASTLDEEVLEEDDKTITTQYIPMGVVAGLVPWNFPLILAMNPVGSGLMAGCCLILKPSPFSPYASLKAVEIAQKVFPPGVLQCLAGDDSLGPMLVQHPDIQKVSFTGSIATGKRIMAECAKTLKRVSLELGGNDACIVCDDVKNLNACAAQVAMGGFFNTGQMCVCTKRVYVHESIYGPFKEAIRNFVKTMVVGPPEKEGVLVGPMQNKMQYEKVLRLFHDAKKQGYEFIVGGEDEKEDERPGKGYFIRPAIVNNPPLDSALIADEQFGPILPIMPYSDIDEAIRLANATPHGLAAAVFADDKATGKRVASRLEAGSVYINSFPKPDIRGFMGGHKESGFGGSGGKTWLRDSCNIRVLHEYK
ncbi:hypothetical protein MMC25_003140 [Agyrium rufum]|nr:hypothetical protein [Agyrium rufum]